jgi:hypothetical protein
MTTDLCTVPICEQGASVSLPSGHLCQSHFITHSYRRLEECGEQIKKRGHLDELVSERLRQALTEIAGGALTVALVGNRVSSMEQAQILDIMASVTNLAQFLPLRVRYELMADRTELTEESKVRFPTL